MADRRNANGGTRQRPAAQTRTHLAHRRFESPPTQQPAIAIMGELGRSRKERPWRTS